MEDSILSGVAAEGWLDLKDVVFGPQIGAGEFSTVYGTPLARSCYCVLPYDCSAHLCCTLLQWEATLVTWWPSRSRQD
jgi:hypothetical protein